MNKIKMQHPCSGSSYDGPPMTPPTEVRPTFPLSDFDKLADVAWFIKGMIAAGNDTFDASHVEAIRNVRDTIHRTHTVQDRQ